MKEEVIFTDEKSLDGIKKRISEEGEDSFHVVADFDKTLTTLFLSNGERVNSLISILRNGNYLDEDYVKRAKDLFAIYHPIEVDQNYPLKEKKEKMYEWWYKHFELLGEKGLNIEILRKCAEDIIKDELIKLRKGFRDFVKFLDKKNIPLIIISASIGDLIKEYLKGMNLLSDDIYVISNELEYDSRGRFKKVKRIVHVLNKDESSVKSFSAVYERVKDRKNVLLLGDGTGDVGMVEGFDYDNLIKVGFLNEDVEKNLDVYKKYFDVVLTGDQDFSYVNKLVEEMFV